jgi:5-oxoprolinase (ATP-hydrolysing) subunit A
LYEATIHILDLFDKTTKNKIEELIPKFTIMNKQNFPFDINCDLGEGLPNDGLLMPYLGSCNIACGGHTGNENTIRDTIRLAKMYQVKIGAHPSYPDAKNFGRIKMDISPESLKKSLMTQLSLFKNISEEENITIHHIKPHGALYNFSATDHETASVILDILELQFPGCYLYCPPNSHMEQLANKRGILIKREVFADRNYNEDGSLVNRTLPNAVITDAGRVLEHIQFIVENGEIRTFNGHRIAMQAETICVHGDNPNALEILKNIHKYFNL